MKFFNCSGVARTSCEEGQNRESITSWVTGSGYPLSTQLATRGSVPATETRRKRFSCFQSMKERFTFCRQIFVLTFAFGN